jgi:hypothetical protein
MPMVVDGGVARWLPRGEYERRFGEWPCRQPQPELGYLLCDGCGAQSDIRDLEEGPGGALLCPACRERGTA